MTRYQRALAIVYALAFVVLVLDLMFWRPG
jgi:hypothetical protein